MATIFGQGFPNSLLDKMGITNHPGYMGAFTRNQAENAIPNGTVIIKVDADPTDPTPLGTPGIVLGSIYDAKISEHPMYFIEWSHKPNFAIAVSGWKIKPKA